MPKILYYYGSLPERRLSAVEKVQMSLSIGGDGDELLNDSNVIPCDEKKDNYIGMGSNSGEDEGLKSVAIVGARKNTTYGEDVAYRLAYELAMRGVVIVSGMAMGIDGIAHRGALAANGKTVAVFGTPINEIYPKSHTGLAKEIVKKGGALMSEYAPGARLDYRRSFLARNRLISGLADVVVVVEANVKSGSLNTATHALEQGRELFAVPGDINRPLSQGCNRLIMQGANPYTGVEDVLSVLFPRTKKCTRKKELLVGDNGDETAILRALQGGINSGEAIINATGMTAQKFNQVITMLEIKGRIRGLGMNRWALS